MCRKYMPEMTRTFCDDEDIRQTLLDHAGKYSKDLYNVLQSPAHRADLFRYVYLYEHGGLYLDIKRLLRMQFDELRSCLAEGWGTAQSYAHSALGHCPSPPGQLPKDYMVMAIGNRGDHTADLAIHCSWRPSFNSTARPSSMGRRRATIPHLLQVSIRCPPREPGSSPAARMEHFQQIWSDLFASGAPQQGPPGSLRHSHGWPLYDHAPQQDRHVHSMLELEARLCW